MQLINLLLIDACPHVFLGDRCVYRKLDPNILMMESAENGTCTASPHTQAPCCVYRKLDPNILMMESAENGT